MQKKRPTDEELQAMTVNERLFVCGLLATWEKAIAGKNRHEAISILRTVALSDVQAIQTADAVLSDPMRYGFRR